MELLFFIVVKCMYCIILLDHSILVCNTVYCISFTIRQFIVVIRVLHNMYSLISVIVGGLGNEEIN